MQQLQKHTAFQQRIPPTAAFLTFYYRATHVNAMVLSGESAAFKLGEAKKGDLVMQHFFKKILKRKSTFHFREYLSYNLKAWTRQLSKLSNGVTHH